MDMEEKFNHGTLMKTRHKADQSWSICKSKTLKRFHLEQCIPKALHDLMEADNDNKLKAAKERFLAYLANLSPSVHKQLQDITLHLVNIQCGFRLHNSIAGRRTSKSICVNLTELTWVSSALVSPGQPTARPTNIWTR